MVVEDLSLSIEQGEFVTLLGPSGSGKTTVLLMLAGFVDPSAGSILLNGRSLAEVPPYRRNMGVVFQNYALFPHRTAAENIAYPLQRRGLSRGEIEDRVRRIIRTVQLDGEADHRPGQLSGGQQQRVALARALVFEPTIVLMDEPLSALDRQLRESMQYEIRRLHDAIGITFIYVTHDQGEALAMSDRVAVLQRGMLQQMASPEELYEHPENEFIARFIGENNLIPVRVRPGRTDQWCTAVLDTGASVRARRSPVSPINEVGLLVVRPERIALHMDAPSAAGVFQGRIVESTYLGGQTRFVVDVPGVGRITVKNPSHPRGRDAAIGDMAYLSWPEDLATVIAPERDSIED
ncbi:MAG: ABC transporter ATP-binding protein [Gammaproteobacteria bacterium]|nr:ABC transporter ATP-binding protein [Gammaproteobacteria bacterium]